MLYIHKEGEKIRVIWVSSAGVRFHSGGCAWARVNKTNTNKLIRKEKKPYLYTDIYCTAASCVGMYYVGKVASSQLLAGATKRGNKHRAGDKRERERESRSANRKRDLEPCRSKVSAVPFNIIVASRLCVLCWQRHPGTKTTRFGEGSLNRINNIDFSQVIKPDFYSWWAAFCQNSEI